VLVLVLDDFAMRELRPTRADDLNELVNRRPVRELAAQASRGHGPEPTAAQWRSCLGWDFTSAAVGRWFGEAAVSTARWD
jgi:hypothetical protein